MNTFVLKLFFLFYAAKEKNSPQINNIKSLLHWVQKQETCNRFLLKNSLSLMQSICFCRCQFMLLSPKRKTFCNYSAIQTTLAFELSFLLDRATQNQILLIFQEFIVTLDFHRAFVLHCGPINALTLLYVLCCLSQSIDFWCFHFFTRFLCLQNFFCPKYQLKPTVLVQQTKCLPA